MEQGNEGAPTQTVAKGQFRREMSDCTTNLQGTPVCMDQMTLATVKSGDTNCAQQMRMRSPHWHLEPPTPMTSLPSGLWLSRLVLNSTAGHPRFHSQVQCHFSSPSLPSFDFALQPSDPYLISWPPSLGPS